MFLLDTNTLIYFFRGDGGVAERLFSVPPAEVATSAITVFELETGLAKSREPDKRRAQLNRLLGSIAVLPFDRAAAASAAAVRASLEKAGRQIGPLDNLIAGTALANRATLVTRNTREFERVAGLHLEDWYE
jgi:tRNA(fMet)-specific endonuclease VapC